MVAPPPEDSQPLSDADLLQRHLAGDEGAFEALLKRYRRELYGFLVRFCGNAAWPPSSPNFIPTSRYTSPVAVMRAVSASQV